MKSTYEVPKASRIEFDYTSTVRASGVAGVSKNPGKGNCTVMPSEKDIPENAVGHIYDNN